MRVYFNMSKMTYPKGGKADGIVYCYHNEGNVCIGRKYYQVPLMKQNTNLIRIEKIALEIWKAMPERVKRDFSIYAKKYKVEYPRFRRKYLNSYSIFLKVIHKIESEYSFSQRQGVSYELYLKLFGECSIADFIKLGYLLPVKDYHKLNAKITTNNQINNLCTKIIILEDIDLFEHRRKELYNYEL